MTRAEFDIKAALVQLRCARELLKQAGATRATAKVRRAMKSAEGALRHAHLAPYREARRDPAHHG